MNTHAQWHVGDGGEYKNNQIYMVDGDYRDYLATTDNEGDARLIVHDHNIAPKLAEALRALRNFCADDWTPGEDEHEDRLMEKVNAALAEWERS